jgi:hypothetical protein
VAAAGPDQGACPDGRHRSAVPLETPGTPADPEGLPSAIIRAGLSKVEEVLSSGTKGAAIRNRPCESHSARLRARNASWRLRPTSLGKHAAVAASSCSWRTVRCQVASAPLSVPDVPRTDQRSPRLVAVRAAGRSRSWTTVRSTRSPSLNELRLLTP